MLMQFGLPNNKRVDIPSYEYEKWFEKHRFEGCHRSVYLFDPRFGFCHPSVAIVNQLFTDIDGNPLEAVELLYNHYLEYKKIFITSGRNIHFILEIEPLPNRYAWASLKSHIKLLELQLDLDLDATSQNLMQMRRIPGSVNEKNGKMASYFDPVSFEESSEPVITGNKTLKIPLVKRRQERWITNKGVFSYDNVDPFKLDIELPFSYKHFDRIFVGRELRNRGVTKDNALDFMKYWLPEDKYEHMLHEGIMERIYAGRL